MTQRVESISRKINVNVTVYLQMFCSACFICKMEQKQTNYGWADMVFWWMQKVHEKCVDGLMLTLGSWFISTSFHVRIRLPSRRALVPTTNTHTNTYLVHIFPFATCMYNVKSANNITCNNFSFFLLILFVSIYY